MRILHISPSLELEWGGVAKAANELTRALARKGVIVSAFTISGKRDGPVARCGEDNVDIKYFPKGPLSRVWTAFSPSLTDFLKKNVSRFDLVHIHGIWHYPGFAAYKAARDSNVPFVVSIHGSLEAWGLKYKALKKEICAALFQRSALEEASALIAVTEGEVDSIRRFVKNRNIFVAANGVNAQEFANLPHKKRFDDLYPEVKGKKVILFLGRLHPVKGLDLLARAFGRILRKKGDVQLVLAGPDYGNHKRNIVGLLKAQNALGNATFTGMLTGQARLAALSRSDVFVLPSYTEVMGLSTLEAMACAVPVVITDGCNFAEVETTGAGFVVTPDSASLSSAIGRLLNDERLSAEMGSAGKRLISEKYTWDKTADRVLKIYEEVLCSPA